MLEFLLCAVLLCSASAEQHDSIKSTDTTEKTKDAEWDVSAPPGDSISISIDVTEGTWMSLDVAPSGEQLVFDLLGDLYLLPIEGGEAQQITSGMAWDMQPRFSPVERR